MNSSDLNHDQNTWRLPRFSTDAAGRLYDPAARQFLARSGGGRPQVLEAVAALTWAAKRMHQGIERYAEAYGLSEGRLSILFRLRKQAAGVSLGELAEMLRVSPRNVTGLIDNLERDGLVARVPDPSDRRSVLAQLTAAGRERIEEIWEGALNAQTKLTEGFTDEELSQLRHLCLRLVEKLEPAAKKEIRV